MRSLLVVCVLMALVALTPAPGAPGFASAEAIVYESFNYLADATIDKQTAESGLSKWTAPGVKATSPGLTYTDANFNVLPVLGNKAFSGYKSDDAIVSLLNTGWSPGSLDNNRVNAKDATIWWSFIYLLKKKDGFETHRFSLTSNNGGYIGLEDTVSGEGTKVTFVGKNDDGTKVTGGDYDMIGKGSTFVVMKLATDALGNTGVSMWFNPLLDGGEALLGTPKSLYIPADSVDGVLHFDKIHLKQLGHSANLTVDEIRMGESYESVVGAVPIPEPGTLALLGMALLGLGWYAWRKRKR